MEFFAPRRVLLQHNATTSSPPPSPIYPSFAGSPYNPSTAAITALVLFSFLSFLGFVSVYARRVLSRDHHNAGHAHVIFGGRANPRAAKGLDVKKLKALPVLPYSAAGTAECVVCLAEIEEGENVKVIPTCGHLFHPLCIDAWLVSRGSCPVCRFDVTVAVEKTAEDRAAGVRSEVPGDRPVAVGREAMVLPWDCRGS